MILSHIRGREALVMLLQAIGCALLGHHWELCCPNLLAVPFYVCRRCAAPKRWIYR